ncbi:MAG: RNA methyltransferase [Chloroflexota bacterium]
MITSIHNRKIQRIRTLLGRRSAREKERAYVIEGARLIEEALASSIPLEMVLISTQPSPRAAELIPTISKLGIPLEETDADLFNRLSDTENPQGILAVVHQVERPLAADWDFLVIADRLRDPGNLGTLLRTAAAAGVDGVILTPECADVYSPKVLRAAMGAHFRLSISRYNWEEIVRLCRNRPHLPASILVSHVEKGVPCWQVDLRQPLALVIGSEAEGISVEARQAASQLITIPMPGRFESLNAAVAAGILLFEVVRQRYT